MARARSSSASGAEVDRLYQLPPGEFVAARNALARTAGPGSASIRARPRPTLPAWAVNQLYWREREIWRQLLDRAADLRTTHAAAARGGRADVRSASRAHEEAVERAFRRTVALLSEEGHTVTDATRQAIATTLRGLPADEPPGRLTRQLEPRGFEMLTGAAGPGRVRTPPAAPKGTKAAPPASNDRQHARITAAQAAASTAREVTRDAEQTFRREEFEAARATREVERADKRAAQAEEAVQEAQAALDEARRAAATAAKSRDAAEARAAGAADRLAAARTREEAARQRLRELSES